MEYKLVTIKHFHLNDDEIKEFEHKINSLIQQGWIPQGGFYYNSEKMVFCQAMIRHKK